jgi:hypothetical protein
MGPNERPVPSATTQLAAGLSRIFFSEANKGILVQKSPPVPLVLLSTTKKGSLFALRS